MTKKNGSSRFSQIIEYIGIIIRDKNRKSAVRIIYEFIILSFKRKQVATYYFTSLLHKTLIKNFKDYLSSKEMHRSQEIFCDQCAVEIVANKLLFQEYFDKRNLRLPLLLGHNFGECFFIHSHNGWSISRISTCDAFGDILRTLISSSSNNTLFIKPINGSLGKGARRISGPVGEWTKEMLMELREYVSSGNFLFQDEVIQHRELCRLNSTSVNTIRIDTFKYGSGDPEVISALLRIGLSGSCIDNIAAGGLFIGIDLMQGILKEYAFDRLSKGGNVYLAHPDTHIVFKGFRIPFINDVKRLAIDAAVLLPPALIGWDIAISPDGPILMEGNAVYYSMELSDLAYGGYRNNPVFRKVLDLLDGKM